MGPAAPGGAGGQKYQNPMAMVAPPGVDWIVWTLKASVPGFHQVGVCHLKNHRLWSILRRD